MAYEVYMTCEDKELDLTTHVKNHARNPCIYVRIPGRRGRIMVRRIQSYPVDPSKNDSNQGRKIRGEAWLSGKQKETLPYERFPQAGMKMP